jgi:hypothetical protein
MITFLIPGLGSYLLSARTSRQNQASGWGRLRHHCSVKRMKEAFEIPCDATTTGIVDNQESRSALGQSKRHTVVLCHNERTSDEMITLMSKKV